MSEKDKDNKVVQFVNWGNSSLHSINIDKKIMELDEKKNYKATDLQSG